MERLDEGRPVNVDDTRVSESGVVRRRRSRGQKSRRRRNAKRRAEWLRQRVPSPRVVLVHEFSVGPPRAVAPRGREG